MKRANARARVCSPGVQASAAWRRSILESHTLKAVIQLPTFTFAPLASVNTHIIVIHKGRAQAGKPTIFHRLGDAGLVLSKGKIRPKSENSNTDAIDAVVALCRPGAMLDTLDAQQSAAVVVDVDCLDWTTGRHLPWQRMTESELEDAAHSLVLSWSAANTTHVREIVMQRSRIEAGALGAVDFTSMYKYDEAVSFRDAQAASTVGNVYLAFYGPTSGVKQLAAGGDLLVSGSMYNNGFTGLYDLRDEVVMVRRAIREFLPCGAACLHALASSDAPLRGASIC
jgi:hypothetical protein